MLEPTIPQLERLRIAGRYIELGWHIFILGEDKRPVANCDRCSRRKAGMNGRTYVWHDEEKCECLMCHGFYAATQDVRRIERMLVERPSGLMAARMGRASGVIALDAEAHADEKSGDGITGLDVLDAWTEWTGLDWTPTLRQRSAGGGLHAVYKLPSDSDGDDDGVRLVHGRNRILPQVDLKAEGGYIVVTDGMEPRRHWMDPVDVLVEVPRALLDWFDEKRGRSRFGVGGGRGVGGSLLSEEEFKACERDGAGVGQREPFIAMLSFKLRKQGKSEREIWQTLRYHWERCEQPDGDFFHWSFVEYKIDRDRSIAPDKSVAQQLQRWSHNVTSHKDQVKSEIQQVGLVTLRRSR